MLCNHSLTVTTIVGSICIQYFLLPLTLIQPPFSPSLSRPLSFEFINYGDMQFNTTYHLWIDYIKHAQGSKHHCMSILPSHSSLHIFLSSYSSPSFSFRSIRAMCAVQASTGAPYTISHDSYIVPVVSDPFCYEFYTWSFTWVPPYYITFQWHHHMQYMLNHEIQSPLTTSEAHAHGCLLFLPPRVLIVHHYWTTVCIMHEGIVITCTYC